MTQSTALARVEDYRADFEKMWANGWTAQMIAKAMGCSPPTVYNRAKALGLPPRKKGRYTAGDKTGQRRFTGVSGNDGVRVDIKPWHPAIRDGATIYGRTVQPAALEERLLKSGENNRKIGSLATKGAWRGCPIFTLTLEERATCPRSCKEWKTCYGNNMGMAVRIFDDGTLQTRLAAQLMHLNAIHPRGFIVRLHVLGDFASVEYAQFWKVSLGRFPALRIFGFTARVPDTEIGGVIAAMNTEHADRCVIRFSGFEGEARGAEVVDVADEASGIVCPGELDPERCCATCGLCWSSTKTISFLRH